MTRNETNFERLLERAKDGESLTSDDLREVMKELESGVHTADPYTLLHIVGKVGDRVALPLVEAYASAGLDDPLDDGMIRRIAVQILGQWWCVKEAYPMIAEKAFEDPSPFVRATAASSLGDLGRTYPELRRSAAQALLRGIARYGKEQRDVWGAFYTGMLELVGIDAPKRPIHPGDLNPEQLDPHLVEMVRKAAA